MFSFNRVVLAVCIIIKATLAQTQPWSPPTNSPKIDLRSSVIKNVTISTDNFELLERVKKMTCGSQAEAVYFYYENNSFPEQYSVDILLKILNDNENCTMGVKGFDSYVTEFKSGNQGKSITVFIFYSMERDFRLAFPGIRKNQQKQHIKYVFVFLKRLNSTEDSEDDRMRVKKLFTSLWEKNILNAIATFQNSKGELNVVTFNPFHDDYFIEMPPYLSNVDNYFTDKLSNINQQPVAVRLVEDKIRARLNSTIEHTKGGTDYELMEFIQRGLNAQFTFVEPKPVTDSDEDPINYEVNFNSMLMTPKFFDDNLTEPSIPLGRDDMQILVPKAGRASKFYNVFNTFGYGVWIAIATMLFICTIIWRYIEKLNKFPTPSHHFLYLYKVQLFQSMSYKNKVSSGRLFFGSWMLYTLVIGSSFTGVLVSVLMNTPNLPNIDTIAELHEQNISVVTLKKYLGTLSEYFNNSMEAESNITSQLIGVADDSVYTKIITQGHDDLAFLHKTFESFYFLYSVTTDGQSLYHLMEETVMPSFVCFSVKRGSWIMPGINKLLRIAEQAGLMDFWVMKNLESFAGNKKISQSTSEESNKEKSLPTPLGIQDLQAAFYFLIVGNILGLIVFLIEISIGKIKNVYQNFKKSRGFQQNGKLFKIDSNRKRVRFEF